MKELKVAKKAARKAGKLILQYYEKSFRVKMKGLIDPVTEVDEKVQTLIVDIIRKEFPHDQFLAEEGDLAETKSVQADSVPVDSDKSKKLNLRDQRRWIIDPIDGTTNFTHGYPCFCVSIAFERNSCLEAGVIYQPILDELFFAQRGKGAYLKTSKRKKRQLQVSPREKLIESLLVTGFPYNHNDLHTNNLPLFCDLMKSSRAVRRDGSAAMNLAYVACGRFDGFWELGLKAWDVAAGLLLVQEAGGELHELSQRRHGGFLRDFLVSTPGIRKEFQQHLLSSYQKHIGN